MMSMIGDKPRLVLAKSDVDPVDEKMTVLTGTEDSIETTLSLSFRVRYLETRPHLPKR